jgi:hypothetical protein
MRASRKVSRVRLRRRRNLDDDEFPVPEFDRVFDEAVLDGGGVKEGECN